jgi:hypothetical protein
MTARGDSKPYTSTKRLFSLEVPEEWFLIGDDEGIATFSSLSGTASVAVSAAKHRRQAVVANACDQLRSYVRKLDIEPTRFREIECSVSLATGDYTDKAGVYWHVLFRASENVVLLATYNREFSSSWKDEDREAETILSSIRIEPATEPGFLSRLFRRGTDSVHGIE